MMHTNLRAAVFVVLGAAAPPVFAAARRPIQVVIRKSSEGLSLARAMELAEKQSHTLKGARFAEAASTARQSQSFGAMGPKLAMEVNESWISSSVNKLAGETLPNGMIYPNRINTVGFVATQPLTGLVALNDKRSADEALHEAAVADVQSLSTLSKTQAAEAYIRVLKTAKLLEIAENSRSVIARQKSDAARLKAMGTLSALDYSRLEFAESEATTQVTNAKSELQIASSALVEAIGFAPDVDSIVLEDLLEDPQVAPGTVTEKTRPELAAADARVRGSEMNRLAVRADHLPNVNAFARYERDFTAKDISIPTGGAGNTLDYSKSDIQDRFIYGVALNWIIWDWNSRNARDRELIAETSRQKEVKEAVAGAIRLETSRAESEVTRAAQSFLNAKLSRDLSESIFKSMELKFRSGLTTTTDLLGSERDLTRAKGNMASARYDLHLAQLMLKRAYGNEL